MIRLYENPSYSGLSTSNNLPNRNFIQKPIVDLDEDDIDTALNKLEKTLDQVDLVNRDAEIRSLSNVDKADDNEDSLINDSKSASIDLMGDHHIEIEDYLLLLRNQKYSFKKFKPYYFVLDSSRYLSFFKTKDDAKNHKPIQRIQLRSCKIQPDVNLATRRFCITLKNESVNSEMTIRFQNEESFANWISAIKLASKNRSISDSIYEKEAQSILNLLNIQNEKNVITLKSEMTNKSIDTNILSTSSIPNKTSLQTLWLQSQAVNLMPIKMLKKFKLKYVSKIYNSFFFHNARSRVCDIVNKQLLAR